MSTTITRPDRLWVDPGGFWNATGGAGDFLSNVSDGSDASYITHNSFNPIAFYLAEASIPAGAVVKSLRLNARLQYDSAAGDVPTLYWNLEEGDSFSQYYANGATQVTIRSNPYDHSFTAAPPIYAGTDVRCHFFIGGSARTLRIYEITLTTTYIEKPSLTIDAPSADFEYTESNAPVISWTPELDDDRGSQPQTGRIVKIFTETEAAAGGFDPDAGTPVFEYEARYDNGGATTLDVANPAGATGTTLANDAYRVYVRIAQTVNGEYHWGDYVSQRFRINVSAPEAPSIVATPSDDDAWIRLDLTEDNSPVITDVLQTQRSADAGATWTDLPTARGGGLTRTGRADTAVEYDWLAGNGQEMLYRVRAGAYFNGGTDTVWSAWVTTPSAVRWSSDRAWLKHPSDASLNVAIDIYSYASEAQEGRATPYMPLGATYPIVVSDTPGPVTGTLGLWLADDAAKAAIAALLAAADPVLIQHPAADARQDRWVVFVARQRDWAIDKLGVSDAIEMLEWIEVDEP